MSTLASQLYLKLLNGAGVVSPTMQKQIFASGIAESDPALIAALAAIPNLLPELDEAIGKRKSAREVAAWCSRPGRTAADLRSRIPKENRIQVLVAIAERPDLEPGDYAKLSAKKMEKVSLTLLRNPGVDSETKKQAALSWVRTVSPSRRTHWKFRSEVEEVLSVVPDAFNDLILHTTSRDVILAGMLNPLNPETQQALLTKLVGPVLKEINAVSGNSVNWSDSKDADTMFDRLEKMVEMEYVTDEFRTGLTELLDKAGPWPSNWRYGYLDSPEKLREKLLKRLRSGKIGTELSPLHIARNSSNPEQLLATARKASQERDEVLALAVASNPSSTVEVLEAVVGGLGWQGMRTVVRAAAERNEIQKIVALVRVNTYMLDDELFETAGNPSETLRRTTAALIRDGSWNSRATYTVLTSRFLTTEILSELPGEALVHNELPDPVRAMLQSILEVELGENAEHWKLFEALLATGDTSLKEMLKTAKAL
jgi:ACT domain-containing protein